MLELQDSAAPYHDWNARITAECYAPNTHSRVLNDKKEIAALVNNYANISFNFGPTLLSWLEANRKDVYDAILDADKQSQKNFSGHGGAIAQVYNHIIMPLANRKDKETQVVWGIKDFEARFKRKPEGMWLAETACDTETLEVLAENDIKFTILAPGQCARVRAPGAKQWTETAGASVDPKRPYICNLPSGKSIVLFFYDGPISQGIAFSDTLKSGENFSARLMGAYNKSDDTQLVHIATDGETYGHHQKFADMALAYCIKDVKERKLAQITVYGEFLEKFPPTYEAQIIENTSWSCFHGVERWRSDCGCNSGGHPNWNQKWRGPLRAALDLVRDETVKNFETLGKEYFKDPWAARNGYIKIMLNRTEKARHEFLLEHATERAWNDRPGAMKLLEMQLNALYMYTSCGWFFDEISGIETVQIMQYAARVIEMNTSLGFKNIEADFIAKLAAAPSNIRGFENGAHVYEAFVRPSAFTVDHGALHYAFAVTRNENLERVFCYKVSEAEREVRGSDKARALLGSAVFENIFTLEKTKKYFALFNAENYRLTCFAGDRPANAAEIENLLLNSGVDAAVEELKNHFGAAFTLSDLTKDAQKLVVDEVLHNVHDKTAELFDKTFDAQYPVLRELKYIGAKLPKPFTFVAQFVFTEDIKAEICKDDVSLARIEELLEDARGLQVALNYEPLANAAARRISVMCREFFDKPDRERALKIVNFLKDMQALPFKADIFAAQETVFSALKKLSKEAMQESAFKVLARMMGLSV